MGYDLTDDSTTPAVGVWDGTISISDRCISWSATGSDDSTTLVWFDGYVAEVPSSPSLVFKRFDGTDLIITDGDAVDLTGMAVRTLADTITRPYEECPADRFLVYDVTPR